MEVRFENGWSGKSWVFDPRAPGLFRQSDATPRHMVPPADVIELATRVYEGLSPKDVAEIEEMARHRPLFDDARR